MRSARSCPWLASWHGGSATDKIAAFDAKQFRRGRRVAGEGQEEKYVGFNSPLGAGIIISDPEEFASRYVRASKNLADSFGIGASAPFFSSNRLKSAVGYPKAISFADQLVSEVQDCIESVHFSYFILSPQKVPAVRVGGLDTPMVDIGTRKFADMLGPMFSYLTAHSYLWSKKYRGIGSLDLHIDAFRSRRTEAWDRITAYRNPKVFTRGDECNPFISCADVVAFLADAKLYGQHLKLYDSNLKGVWDGYSFGVSAQFFGPGSLPYCTWRSDVMIDLSGHLARPVVFLAIDEIEYEADDDGQPDRIDVPAGPRKFNRVIKQSPVYHAALRLAFERGGCMKIFSRAEDMALVRDGDVFIYVGMDSEDIAKRLQYAFRIQAISGIEARDLVEKVRS